MAILSQILVQERRFLTNCIQALYRPYSDLIQIFNPCAAIMVRISSSIKPESEELMSPLALKAVLIMVQD